MMPTVVFPVGRETLAWIRDGGTPSRASWSGRLMLGWQNYWFDRTLGLQRRLPSAPALSSDPVFILGLWRTGTTHLHELFSACPGLLCAATWQCMNPASLRLNAAPRQSRMMQRPMDHLSISALSPQEDEFALLALGVPSIYRGFLDPRRLPELSQWLDPAVWASGEPPGWTTAWQEFLSGVVAGRSGRLTLKSPSHTFRVRALTEFFPKASYVWLIRDPVATFLSNR